MPLYYRLDDLGYMSSPTPSCPYPACAHSLADGSLETCSCEYRLPVTRCQSCSTSNVAHARYCRSCQRDLRAAEAKAVRWNASSVELIENPGEFHYPPAISQGVAWCVDTAGRVTRLSPRQGAKPYLWSELPSRLPGFNRALAVTAVSGAPPFRGPVLLSTDPGGVYGISLLTGECRVLDRPPGRSEIVANTTAEESIGFRGLAANPEMVCYLLRAQGAPEAKLAIRYFHPQRGAEDPLAIAGTSFLTPVIAGSLIGVCSDEEVWIYDLRDQSKFSFQLPRNFRPFFARSWQMNIPQGSVPLAVSPSNRGREVWIAGLQNEREAGILRVAMDRQYADFLRMAKGAAIADAFPSGWSVNAVDNAVFFGVDRPNGRIGAMQPGMPIGYAAPRLAFFNRSGSPGRHSLTLLAGEPVELGFDDILCNEDSCCGISFYDAGIVVSYLNRSNPNSRGLKLANWHLAG
jgi:hypothetical protein